MSGHSAKDLIAILRESPLYSMLSDEEERCLLARLTERYPFLLEKTHEEMGPGHERGGHVK